MPTDPIKTYPDLLAALVAEIAKPAPDTAKVAALVQQGKLQFPDHIAEIDRLVAPAPEAAQPASNWMGITTHGGALTAGVLATYLYAYSDQIRQFIVDNGLSVESRWVLLIIIAVVGGIAGLLNAVLADSSLILPRFERVNDKITFFPGFLGNVATGALTAVVTVWLASPAQAGAASTQEPAASAPANPPAADTSKNLLTPAILISAFATGFCGSRVVTGQRDKNLLMAAAQTALTRPSDPAASAAFGASRSILEGFKIATGQSALKDQSAVPTSAPAHPNAAEAELLSLLDISALQSYFAGLLVAGKPLILSRDGAGLTLNVLKPANPPLPEAAKRWPLIEIAGASQELLKSVPPPAGADATAFNDALSQAWTAAREVKSKLDKMPADWTLKPSALPPLSHDGAYPKS